MFAGTERHERGAEVAARVVVESDDERMLAQHLLHAGTLDADAAPVHEAHLVQPGVCGRLDVRGHDIGDVARRERVEIELGSDRHDVSHRTNGRTAYGSGLKEHCGLRLKAQGSESTAA